MAVIHANEQTYRELLAEGKPLVVDFFADWCMPCKALAPIAEQLSEEWSGKATFVKVDVDECEAIAAENRVLSIPTLVVFVGGKPVARVTGLRNKQQLGEFLAENLNL